MVKHKLDESEYVIPWYFFVDPNVLQNTIHVLLTHLVGVDVVATWIRVR